MTTIWFPNQQVLASRKGGTPPCSFITLASFLRSSDTKTRSAGCQLTSFTPGLWVHGRNRWKFCFQDNLWSDPPPDGIHMLTPLHGAADTRRVCSCTGGWSERGGGNSRSVWTNHVSGIGLFPRFSGGFLTGLLLGQKKGFPGLLGPVLLSSGRCYINHLV